MQKHKLKRNIQKGLSIIAAGVVLLTSTSCSKNENKTSTIQNNPSLVSAERYNGEITDYKYLVDCSKIFSHLDMNEKGMALFKVIDSKEISTEDFLNELDGDKKTYWSWSKITMMKNFLSQPQPLVIPDCYTHFLDYKTPIYREENGKIIFNNIDTWRNVFNKANCYYKEELIQAERFGYMTLKLVYNKIEFEKEIELKSSETYYWIDEPIHKGDTIESYSLYLSNLDGECRELIAYYQTGAGSHCENVQNANFGDLHSIITTIEKAQIVEEPVTLTEDERRALEDSLEHSEINQNGIVVTKGRSK